DPRTTRSPTSARRSRGCSPRVRSRRQCNSPTGCRIGGRWTGRGTNPPRPLLPGERLRDATARRGHRMRPGDALEPPERFREAVATELEEWTEEVARKVLRLEAGAAAVVWLLDGGNARQKSARLLPSDGREERIAKYERHLHNLLTSTLHELERLQARRKGEAVPPPALADVNVIVGNG